MLVLLFHGAEVYITQRDAKLYICPQFLCQNF